MSKQFRNFEVYIIHVEGDMCDGCEACVKICPCDVFAFSIKALPLNPQNCLGCRVCEAICKSFAVTVTEI